MKIGNTNQHCPYHGITKHGVYTYGNKLNGEPRITVRCLECIKDDKNRRHQDPEKKIHDRSYTKNWAKNNPEKISLYQEKALQKNRELAAKKYKKAIDFIESNKDHINFVLKKFKSELTIEDIKTRCIKLKLNTIKRIENYIESNKYASIVDKETWKKSSLLKYDYGVRENFNEQPQSLKDKINKKSRDYAKEIATKKINRMKAKLHRFNSVIPVN